MQATQSPRKVFLPKHGSKKRLAKSAKSANQNMTTYVVDEINAFAVIRDIALAEAEKEPSPLNLERARIANNFVENCVKPARSPYGAQHLPEADAAREQKRCGDAKVRLALLQAHLEAVTRETDPAPAPIAS
jgi:hypothetical protein